MSEPVFDENGWCWDIDLAPKDGREFIGGNSSEVFTCKYERSNVGNDAPFFARTSNGETWNAGSYYQHENEYMFLTAWQPLPSPPKGGE